MLERRDKCDTYPTSLLSNIFYHFTFPGFPFILLTYKKQTRNWYSLGLLSALNLEWEKFLDEIDEAMWE